MNAMRTTILSILLVVFSGCTVFSAAESLGRLRSGDLSALGQTDEQQANLRRLEQAGKAQLPVSPEEEAEYGGAVAVEIVHRAGPIADKHPAANYVRLVGHALAAYSTKPDLKWHFALLDNPDVLAMSTPGGYVFVSTGALQACKSEAELAGLLAHEISHVTAGHGTRIMQNAKSKQALLDDPELKQSALYTQVFDGYLDAYLTRGLPQDDEFDADLAGTQLLVRVGWQARGLRDFLQTMSGRNSAQKHDKYFDTHPDTAKRIAKLDTLLATLPATGAANTARLQQNLAAPPAK